MKKNLKNIYIDDGFIMLTYIFMNILALLAYLFMVPFRVEGINFEIYKNTYMYFYIFQLIVFSFSIVHFKVEKNISFENLLGNIIKTIILVISNIPLILIILISGNVESLNFTYPLILQTIYGLAIISFKHLLNIIDITEKYSSFIVNFSVTFINIFSFAFLYIYYKYAQMVITTIYDKDIPKIFFINPLMSISGFINMEITEYTQMGITPIIWGICFWTICALINLVVIKKIGGHSIGMENN
ncbi:hypothetical protein DP125_09915 [Clostridium tetani]|uniref:hypothetical protein n=1 Tax=Clostridium tetani TaxID=1513 RepID=UPI00100A8AC6|nr:hypothetical protein [Clostridium tetani]RXI59300.1 hypothetical protein DP125_09915 [Clostridium tetani]